tara:strand:+ start:2976 stop:3095 length:120 start_codon:yes stop_codon:yes gene_type:complete
MPLDENTLLFLHIILIDIIKSTPIRLLPFEGEAGRGCFA